MSACQCVRADALGYACCLVTRACKVVTAAWRTMCWLRWRRIAGAASRIILSNCSSQLEDRVACVPGIPGPCNSTCSFYGVFDGHEGEKAAVFAAEQLPAAVTRQLNALRNAASGDCGEDHAIQAVLQRAVADTDAAFLRQAEAQGLADGTTAVFALLCGRRLLIGSIGDSFAILCGSQQASNASSHVNSDADVLHSTTAAPAVKGGAPESAAGSVAAHAEVLSAMHSPAREDERRRIEASRSLRQPMRSQRDVWCIGASQQINKTSHQLSSRGRQAACDP